jgi:hypothetical protein
MTWQHDQGQKHNHTEPMHGTRAERAKGQAEAFSVVLHGKHPWSAAIDGWRNTRIVAALEPNSLTSLRS